MDKHRLGLEGGLVLAEDSPVGRTAVEDLRSPFHSGSHLHIVVADHTVADAVHMQADDLGLGRTGSQDRNRLGRVAVGVEEDIADSLDHHLRNKTDWTLVAAAVLRSLAVGILDCSSGRNHRIGHQEDRTRFGLDIPTCLVIQGAIS